MHFFSMMQYVLTANLKGTSQGNIVNEPNNAMASRLFNLLLEYGNGRGKHCSTTTTQDTNIQLLSQVQGFDKTVCIW